MFSSLTKHVPRTRGLKLYAQVNRSGHAANIAYQTCSPHTGIETPTPCRTGGGRNPHPYQTCSPHTGIETATSEALAHSPAPCRMLTKHVPRTRGLKQEACFLARWQSHLLTKHVPRTRGLKRVYGSASIDFLWFWNLRLTKHVPRTRGLKRCRSCNSGPHRPCSLTLTKHVPRTRGLKRACINPPASQRERLV